MGKATGRVEITHLYLEHALTISQPEKKRVKAINALLAKAQRKTGDGEEIGGTPLTVLKRRDSPVALLLDRHKIGAEEQRAAQELSEAFAALAGASMFKSQTLDRVDGGRAESDWHYAVVKMVQTYQKFAAHWSIRAKRGDPTLEIMIAAVIDERPVRTIAADLGFHHRRVENALIRGLRDYAARAGWLDHQLAARWKAEAGMTFNIVHPGLAMAILAAKRVPQVCDSE